MLNLRTGKNDLAPVALTRRDFGKGLAAILAAGCAPAIASAAARGAGGNARMGGMRGAAAAAYNLSARAYVQDGLIAMWDGIENGGFGICNNNPSVWIDCMRPSFGYKFNVNSTDVWSTSGLTISSAHSVGGSDSNWYLYGLFDHGTCTTGCIEVCMEIQNVVQNGGCVVRWDGSLDGPFSIATPWGYLRFTGGGTGSYFNDNESYSLSSYLGRSFAATFSVPFDSNYLYKDGILVRSEFSKVFGSSSAHPFYISNGGQTMKLHSIRMYNKNLTAAEIAANYAIDKARFGLT